VRKIRSIDFKLRDSLNHDREKDFEKDIGRLLDYLSYCFKRGGRLKTFIWVEPTPQHFVGPDGDFHSVLDNFVDVIEENHTRNFTEEDMEQFARDRNMIMEELKDADAHFNASTMRCWPHQRIHGATHAIPWRSALFQKALQDRGMGIDGAVVGIMTPAVYILPTSDFMSNLSYMHPGDCTHWCYTPMSYEPIWHRLHGIFDKMQGN